MSEQYKPNIGEVPDDTARRDAIHIAVVPITAAVDMFSGQVFGLTCDGMAAPSDGMFVVHSRVGIVDPFRKDVVKEGTRFWGFLFPNTITDLRHTWSHPAFKPKPMGV